MNVNLILFMIVLTQDIATPVKVDLQGPLYAKSGDKIWVNCSSDNKPVGGITEFIVNGVTLNSLKQQSNGCYSANTRTECRKDTCQCSKDGKSYGIRIMINQQRANIDVVCSMKFKISQTLFRNDSISVQVLDIIGPHISPIRVPIASGTNINLKCSVITTLEIEIHWNCLNFTSVQLEQQDATFTATLFIQLRASYNGNICTCIARFRNYTTSTNVIFKISSPPVLTVNNPVQCNQTSNIMLFCVLSGELQTYGFYLWTHTINGKFIRYLKGNINKVTSTLLISSCSYKDVGDYECRAWNQIGKEIYDSNKTTRIIVNHAPVIAHTIMHKGPNLTYVVHYYSNDLNIFITWFKYTESIANSMMYSISSAEQNVSLEVYGKRVVLLGYATSLSIRRHTLGDYSVILRNAFGETRHLFKQIQGGGVFDFLNISMVLTGIVVFILTMGIMAVTMKVRNIHTSRKAAFYRQTETRAIYYAAPEDEHNIHVYNTPNQGHEDIIESATGVYMEIQDMYEDVDVNRLDDQQYEIAHNYLEI